MSDFAALRLCSCVASCVVVGGVGGLEGSVARSFVVAWLAGELDYLGAGGLRLGTEV